MMNQFNIQNSLFPKFGMAKVVIGDDDKSQRDYWRNALGYAGIGPDDIEEADTYQGAIEAIKPDTKLVITDLNYKDGKPDGGFDVLSAAAEKGVTAIMNTSDATAANQLKSYKAGAEEFLDKTTLDIEKDVSLIRRVLR